MTTGLLYDPVFLEHQTSAGHPECSQRLTATMSHLKKQPLYTSLKPVAAKQVEKQWLYKIHDEDYIRRAEEVCRSGEPYLDSMDVSVCSDSFDVAKSATGGCLALADSLMSQEISNGFGLLRPPGHHAEYDSALGFCLFNNIAILARYLQIEHGLERVLILDWDVHHGNGTQHSFESDPSVLYISTHQYPWYPGTGAASEIGTGAGQGATLNCPMPAGSDDDDYEHIFQEKILPKIDEFKPEVILVSAGFDAHIDDPLGEIRLSTAFFGWMSRILMEKADRYANGRLISLLEGGYNLQALPLCIADHLKALSN